jgi:hypothetical protein
MSTETEKAPLGALDDLDAIRARARLLELALLGSGESGMSLDGGAYLDAITQQASDVAHQLDLLAERMGGKATEARS